MDGDKRAQIQDDFLTDGRNSEGLKFPHWWDFYFSTQIIELIYIYPTFYSFQFAFMIKRCMMGGKHIP